MVRSRLQSNWLAVSHARKGIFDSFVFSDAFYIFCSKQKDFNELV